MADACRYFTCPANHGIFAKKASLVRELEVDGMPLPTVLEELYKQKAALTTEVSILTQDLAAKDEDLLISNQDLLDAKKDLELLAETQAAMTQQHAALLESAASNEAAVRVANSQMAKDSTKILALTSELDAKAKALDFAELELSTTRSQLDSESKKNAQLEALYETTKSDAKSHLHQGHQASIELDEARAAAAEAERLRTKAEIDRESMQGQMDILQSKCARLEKEVGLASNSRDELESMRQEIINNERQKSTALEAELADAQASLAIATQQTTLLTLQLDEAAAAKKAAEKNLETQIRSQRDTGSAETDELRVQLRSSHDQVAAMQNELNALGFSTVAQAHDEIKQHRSSLAEAAEAANETRLAHAAQMRTELAAQKAGLEEESARLRKQLADTRSAAVEQTIAFADLEDKLADALQQVSAVRSEFDSADERAKRAEERERSANRVLAKESEKRKMAEENVANARDTDERGQEWEGKALDLEADLVAAREQCANATGTIAGLENCLRTSEQDVDLAREDVLALRSDVAGLKSELAAAKFAAVGSVVAGTSTLEDKLRELAGKLVLSNSHVEELLADAVEKESEIAEQDDVVEDLQASRADQQAINDGLAAQIKKLQQNERGCLGPCEIRSTRAIFPC